MAKKAKKAKRDKAIEPVREEIKGPIQHSQTSEPREQQFDPVWAIGCIIVTATAFFVRFFWLGLKPFHHDEGVNGWFLTTLSAKAFINTIRQITTALRCITSR